ncbi:MAG: hemerythrin family protein [Thermosphaera sp.]
MSIYENCLKAINLGVKSGIQEINTLLDISEVMIVDRVKGDLERVLKVVATSSKDDYFYIEIRNDFLKAKCLLLFEEGRLIKAGCEPLESNNVIIPEVFCSSLHESLISLYKLILPSLQWKDEMITGYEPIDSQHRELLNMWNDFIKKLMKDPNNSIEFLEALMNKINNHFSFEEELMRKSKYQGMKKHVKEHEDFRKILNQLLLRSYEIGVLESLRESLGLIYAYLHHLITFDKSLALYMAKQ